MGYTSGWYSKAELCRHLTSARSLSERRFDAPRRAFLAADTLLASCYRGNNFSGILWCVWERRFYQGTTRVPWLDDRYIICNAINCYKGEWGYKDISECMGPFYYSCPVGYLDMVPLDRFAGDPEWRAEVRRVHAQTMEKRAKTLACNAERNQSRRIARKQLAEARAELDRRRHACKTA